MPQKQYKQGAAFLKCEMSGENSKRKRVGGEGGHRVPLATTITQQETDDVPADALPRVYLHHPSQLRVLGEGAGT